MADDEPVRPTAYGAEVIEFSDNDDDMLERLPWSSDYLVVCLMLPHLNGFIHGFTGCAQALYFRQMGWPLWRLAIALAAGFMVRPFCQHFQVQSGIWVALPVAMLHLIAASFAVGFTAEEPAILVQLVAIYGLDCTGAIEGIAYDSYAHELFAIQATSTALAVFTITIALAYTLGALIFELAGWQGISIFHCSVQALLVLLLWIHRACRRSFWDWLAEFEYTDSDGEGEDEEMPMKSILPNADEPNQGVQESPDLPGAADLTVEDVEQDKGLEVATVEPNGSEEPPKEPAEAVAARAEAHRDGVSVRWDLQQVGAEEVEVPDQESKSGGVAYDDLPDLPDEDLIPTAGRKSFKSTMNQYTPKKHSRRTRRDERRISITSNSSSPSRVIGRETSGDTRREARQSTNSRTSRSSGRASKVSRASRGKSVRSTARFAEDEVETIEGEDPDVLSSPRNRRRRSSRKTQQSRASRKSERTQFSARSGHTAHTVRSQLTSLAAAGGNFEHHFMANSTLGPQIIQRTGNPEEEVEEVEESVFDVPLALKRGEVHSSSRIPLFLAIFCLCTCGFCYASELLLFGIYFREYHGITSPVASAIGQTVGDFLAAGILQSIQLSYDPDAGESLERLTTFMERIFFVPYQVSFTMAGWVLLLSLWLVPSAPLAIVVQALVATLYCLSARWTSEVMMFYCGDDGLAHRRMQVIAGHGQSFFSAVAALLGFLLFDVDPVLPIIVAASLCALAFLAYTVGFCVLVGYRRVTLEDEDPEVPEAEET